MSLPNVLTLLRILLIPFFVFAFLVPFPHHRLIAALIFGLTSLTDVLDGYFARLLKRESAFGVFLDPVADKLVVACALVLLVLDNPTFWLALPAIVVIGREIAVSALREWMAWVGMRGKVTVSIYGKVKTTAQMVAIFLLVWQEPEARGWTYPLGIVMLYVAAALTMVSMCQYLVRAWPDLYASQRLSPEMPAKSGASPAFLGPARGQVAEEAADRAAGGKAADCD